jgi:hypothetical protein
MPLGNDAIGLARLIGPKNCFALRRGGSLDQRTPPCWRYVSRFFACGPAPLTLRGKLLKSTSGYKHTSFYNKRDLRATSCIARVRIEVLSPSRLHP